MALTQSHFRFGIEELLEATHGWYATEDTNTSLPVNTTFLLRFNVQADTTGLTNVDNEFQYNKNGAGWVNITTSSAVVKAVVSVAFVDAANCTKRLSGTGTFETTASGCTEDGISGGTTNDIVASGCSETECALQIVGAAVIPGDTIQFRLTRDGGVLLDTYAVTPSLTVSSGNVTVTPGIISLTTTLYIPTVTVEATGTTVTPGTANLVITYYTSAIILGTVVTPGTLAQTTTLYTPSVILGTVVTPGVVSLTTTLYVATVTVTNNVTVAPGFATLTTTSYAPTIEIDVVVVPGVASLTTTRFTPSVILGTIVIPGVGSVGITAYIPTVTVSENVTVTPGTLSLTITSFASNTLVFVPYGSPFLWTVANWGTVTIRLEVYMRATTGTVYAQFFNITDNSFVSNSRLSTTNSSFNRNRSSALALTDNNEYRVQFGKETLDTGEFLGAKLIMN